MATSFTAHNLAAALDCAAAGARVFPAKAIYNREVERWNKPPAIIDWRSKATTDSRAIMDWWQRHPDAIPAICCNEVVVIDADRHNRGGDGVAALKALGIRNGEWPDHPIALTPGDGEHHYFAQSSQALGNRTGNLPRCIDVRGIGGFVIAPGAVRPDGRGWQMIPNCCSDLPPLPPWLEDMIRADRDGLDISPREERKRMPSHDGVRILYVDAASPIVNREERYAAAALEACCAEVMAAPKGKRNITLNNVAYRLGRMIARGWTERSDVEDSLLRAAFQLQREDGRAAAMATINSGIDAGYGIPHPDLVGRNGGGR